MRRPSHITELTITYIRILATTGAMEGGRHLLDLQLVSFVSDHPAQASHHVPGDRLADLYAPSVQAYIPALRGCLTNSLA